MYIPYIVLPTICLAALCLGRRDIGLRSSRERFLVSENVEDPMERTKNMQADQVDNVSGDLDISVKFYLFTMKNPDVPQRLRTNNATSIKSSNFDSSKLTKFLIHGYMNDVWSDIIQLNKKGFLSNYDYNIIAVDWSSLSTSILFPIVIAHVPQVGSYVAQFINYMIGQGFLKPYDVHMIAHSLGAHVAGIAGKIIQKDGYNISRISGLDAAVTGYKYTTPSQRLAPSDADYVDCIHTTGGFIGFYIPLCQADYYPNGGRDAQPGCFPIDFGVCSHKRAYEYYAASINSSNVFTAMTCASYTNLPENCESKGAVMGWPAGQQRYQGIFYLKTAPNEPYVMVS